MSPRWRNFATSGHTEFTQIIMSGGVGGGESLQSMRACAPTLSLALALTSPSKKFCQKIERKKIRNR